MQTDTIRNGHPKFYQILDALADLHSAKNGDYAGGGRPLGNFERVAQLLGMYPGFPINTTYGVALVYALKQLDAALHLMATKRKGNVEGVPERLQDIAVYAVLAMIMYEETHTVAHDDGDYTVHDWGRDFKFTEGDKQPKPAPQRLGGDNPDLKFEDYGKDAARRALTNQPGNVEEYLDRFRELNGKE
jgi:hypothetical protein